MAGSPQAVDFFARQHAARGTSVKLVSLFVLAVVCIVVAIDLVVLLVTTGSGSTGSIVSWLIVATVVTVLVISGGTLSKLIALRAGGVAVARSVGAVPVDPSTSDPQLRRYINVVEEMSIASGIPVPRLFVLESEDGINAFAAGYTPADAAVTITAGALHQLNRDELQGVIAHEFSHVLNGDMKLNLRLIGLLNGLLLLGLVGLRILAFGGGRGRDRDSSAAPVLVFAIAALILGFIGQFFAGLIKAAVSRQREWLADASAVQFTRQSSGLAGALKKIAGVSSGSALRDAHAEKQINHMLFGEGKKSVSSLWATHPPLIERIAALEPGFDAAAERAVQQQYRDTVPDGMAEDVQRGLVGSAIAAPAPRVQVTPSAVVARVGTFAPEDLARGAALSAQLDPQVRQLAAQPSTAVPLVLALLLDRSAPVRDRQLALISDQVWPGVAAAAADLFPTASAVPPLLRLPVVAIALPVVVGRPASALDRVLAVLDGLIRADGTVTVFEYCLTRLVAGYVRDALSPADRARAGHATMNQVQDAATTLLAVVAAAGHADHADAERAFAAGIATLGLPTRPFRPPTDFAAALDAVWAPLNGLDPRDKRPVVAALVAAANADGVLAVSEAELLRTACALLHCPLPAMLS
ncbi:MAG TPA: M48 family metallopeptidase [Jatrophihabitans sp.]